VPDEPGRMPSHTRGEYVLGLGSSCVEDDTSDCPVVNAEPRRVLSRTRYRASVPATGDDVGNNGHVEVAACADGSVALGVRRRGEIETVWLTYGQVVDLATALLRTVERG
jgi:hypothetical protein